MTLASHLARLLVAFAIVAVVALLALPYLAHGFPKCGPHSPHGPRLAGAMVLYGCP